MAGTFGGYGLPLQGCLPAELAGAARYALGEENTRAPVSHGEEGVPPEEVVRDNNLVKVKPRTRCLPAVGRQQRRSCGSLWATRRLTQRAVAGHRGAHLERHRVRRGAPVRVQLLPGASRAVDGVCRDATPEPAHHPCPNARPVRGRHAPRRPGPVQAHREGHGRLVVPHPGPGRWRSPALCGRPRPGTPTNTPALLLPRRL